MRKPRSGPAVRTSVPRGSDHYQGSGSLIPALGGACLLAILLYFALPLALIFTWSSTLAVGAQALAGRKSQEIKTPDLYAKALISQMPESSTGSTAAPDVSKT